MINRFKGRNRSQMKNIPTAITPAHPKPLSQSMVTSSSGRRAAKGQRWQRVER